MWCAIIDSVHDTIDYGVMNTTREPRCSPAMITTVSRVSNPSRNNTHEGSHSIVPSVEKRSSYLKGAWLGWTARSSGEDERLIISLYDNK